jgi:hypothetical protein
MYDHLEKNNLNNSRFLIQKHGGHKEMEHFSSTERKELSFHNSISSKISLRNEDEIK